jgi:Spy/CpxP family protein refolding chaperone
MKINLLTVSALAVALAIPVAASAQQAQPPAGHARAHMTAGGPQLHHRWMKRFGHLNLSGDQQQRIGSMIDQYSQGHPQGSPVDRNANRELRRQIMGVLTPDQQNQFRQERQAHRAQMQQRRAQMQGQGGYQNQQGGYQDQQGGYQGQGQYPQGQYQGPPNGDPRDQQQPYGPGPNQGPPSQGPQPYQNGPYQGQPPAEGPPDQQPPPA